MTLLPIRLRMRLSICKQKLLVELLRQHKYALALFLINKATFYSIAIAGAMKASSLVLDLNFMLNSLFVGLIM